MEKTKAILQGLCSYFHSDAGDLRARCTGCFDCRDRPRCSSISKTFPTNVASNKREIDVTRLSLDPRCKLFVTFFASVTLMISLTWTKELIVISFCLSCFYLAVSGERDCCFRAVSIIVFGRRFLQGKTIQ